MRLPSKLAAAIHNNVPKLEPFYTAPWCVFFYPVPNTRQELSVCAQKEQLDIEFFSIFLGIDLALLSQANHSILTYGTFGMWGALMSAGSAVMPSTHVKTIVSQEIQEANLPGWIFI